MKAAVLREVNKPLEIEDVECNSPGPREVLIKTAAAGVCHSDLHFINGSYPHQLPVTTYLSAFCGHCESFLTELMSLRQEPALPRGSEKPP